MSSHTIETYEDSAGEWRWRLRHANGNVVADSGEGYVNKEDMLEMAKGLFVGIGVVEIRDPYAGGEE